MSEIFSQYLLFLVPVARCNNSSLSGLMKLIMASLVTADGAATKEGLTEFTGVSVCWDLGV